MGGRRHTADEEESLFPRLRAESTAATSSEISLARERSSPRQRSARAVDALYTAWIAAGHFHPEDEQRLQSATKQLKCLYEEHIQIEEKTVFPRATEMLDSQTIAAIGLEFSGTAEIKSSCRNAPWRVIREWFFASQVG